MEETEQGSGPVALATDEDEQEITCPLFMDGLPKDFSTNPKLAAIASLLGKSDESEHDNFPKEALTVKKAEMNPKPKGKLRRGKSSTRQARRSKPYENVRNSCDAKKTNHSNPRRGSAFSEHVEA